MCKIDRASTNDEKVRLFRSLFAGRADVFARRYENAKKGTSGYSPFCRNQWSSGCALRRHGKCADCPVRQFVPVSDGTVRAHLRGKDANLRPFVMGIYPMSADETVRLAVIDFDESAWRRDALLVVRKARELALPPALEVSRSGRGAHLWFFFQSPVPARIARAALTHVRNVFVNDDWVPYADQWAFLSSVTRIGRVTLEALLRKERDGRQLFLLAAHAAADGARPWEFFLPLRSAGSIGGVPAAQTPIADVSVVLANRVYVEQERLTPAVRCRLIGLASFRNPEFYSR